MDEIRKLFERISKEDKDAILKTIEKLHDNDRRKEMSIKKIEGTDFFRVRQGRYRIIFRYKDSGAGVKIYFVRTRNEKTYDI